MIHFFSLIARKNVVTESWLQEKMISLFHRRKLMGQLQRNFILITCYKLHSQMLNQHLKATVSLRHILFKNKVVLELLSLEMISVSVKQVT